MSLDEYKKKQDFKKTAEPSENGIKNSYGKLKYAIQEHHASHLHYDLRLEMNGVLLSWAIPKKPEKEGKARRLAVQTEDHPLGYESFEGEIPQGEYGAGRVKIWDSGFWTPMEFTDDKIIGEISGQKLSGIWCLIRLKKDKFSKGEGTKRNWLFFKKMTKSGKQS